MEKIIKKKLLLIVSMLAVTFALAGCTSSDKKVEFSYDKNTLVQTVENQAQYYIQTSNVKEIYDYAVEEGGNSENDAIAVEAIKVFATMNKDYGDFISFIDFKDDKELDKAVQEVDDKVTVSVYAKCTEKEAVIKATFVDNSAAYNYQKYNVMNQNGYTEEQANQLLTSNGIYPYKISEFEVAANQTLKDKMKDAGANTLIGMGIVFIALIFISFIISLLKYVPPVVDKVSNTIARRKAEKAKKKAKKKAMKAENATSEIGEAASEKTTSTERTAVGITDIVNTATGESVMDDSELVAVISAAVMAAQGGKTRVRVNYPSNDKLVVRPRKKNKR